MKKQIFLFILIISFISGIKSQTNPVGQPELPSSQTHNTMIVKNGSFANSGILYSPGGPSGPGSNPGENVDDNEEGGDNRVGETPVGEGVLFLLLLASGMYFRIKRQRKIFQPIKKQC